MDSAAPGRRAAAVAVAAVAAAGSTRLVGAEPPPALGRPLLALVNAVGRVAYLEHERPTGATPDFFRELAQRAGLPLQVQLLPRARLLAELQQGRADLIVATRQTPAELKGDFVPVARLRVMLVCDRRLAAAAPADLASLVERSDWRGLIVRGAALSEMVQTALHRLEQQRRLWQVRDWATVLRMLLAERAEFTLYSPTLLQGETTWMGADARDRLVARPLADLPAHEIGIHIAAHLPAEVRALLLRHAQAMVREGVMRRLMLRAHPAELLAQDLQFLDTLEARP